MPVFFQNHRGRMTQTARAIAASLDEHSYTPRIVRLPVSDLDRDVPAAWKVAVEEALRAALIRASLVTDGLMLHTAPWSVVRSGAMTSADQDTFVTSAACGPF